MNKKVIEKQEQLLKLLKLADLPEQAVKAMIEIAYIYGQDDGFKHAEKIALEAIRGKNENK